MIGSITIINKAVIFRYPPCLVFLKNYCYIVVIGKVMDIISHIFINSCVELYAELTKARLGFKMMFFAHVAINVAGVKFALLLIASLKECTHLMPS